MNELQKVKKAYLNINNDEQPFIIIIEKADNYIKELEESNAEMFEALIDADETICIICKRLNPQHIDCTSCEERNDRIKIIERKILD